MFARFLTALLWVFPVLLPAPLPARDASPATADVLLVTAPNFRDMGGYPLAAGRQFARGRVFRSGELSSLSAEDALAVARLHPAAVVDLRTVEERQRAPSIWAVKPADVFESSKQSLAPFTHAILDGALTADGARRGIQGFYRQMPKLYREEYAAMFHRMARGELPMIVHCTAGKDRTGVAMAILLESLGASRAVVVRDYTLTNERLARTANAAGTPTVGAKTIAVNAMSALPAEARRALWEASPDYINSALDAIDARFGSVENYIRQDLGVSAAELRTIHNLLTE